MTKTQTSSMTRMEKVVLLLTFWFSPWGAAKGATWEWLVDDKMEFAEDSILTIMGYIINGVDEKRIDWQALEVFKIEVAEELGLLEESLDVADSENPDRIDVV